MTIHRKTMSAARMVLFGVSASGLMIVLGGGIPTAYGVSGNRGLPLAFLVVGAVLGLLSVGYLAMARRVQHPAVYYAVVAAGLGRAFGVGVGMLSLTAYNSILICMFGFLGGSLAHLLGGAWWVYAALAWALIAWLGVRPVVVSAWALGTVLGFSLLIAVLFLVDAVAHPAAGHLSVDGYSWESLRGSGLSAALILCVASVMGFDGTASFGTEAVDPAGTGKATTRSLWLLVGGYSVLAWAMGVRYGVDQVSALAADPAVGVPIDALVAQYGFTLRPAALLVLILGIGATILSVHAVVARYVYAMAKEHVLPSAAAFPGRGDQAGGPVGGSRLQSGLSAVVIAGFAVSGADPMKTMFPWLATLGALGLVASLVLASFAGIVHLRGGGESVWVRAVAPTAGVVLGGWLFALMVSHSDVLLGVGPGSMIPVVIPGVLGVVTAGGLLWAWYLRAARPEVYEQIGRPPGGPLHAVPGQLLDVRV